MPVGLLVGPSTAALEILNWFLPLCFGWYIATRADDVHRIEAAAASTFIAGAFVTGLYGMYQFVSPPLWDINWMQRSGMTTIGRPVPFEVRVFGTMHSPGILASFLVIPLVLWLARPRASSIARRRRCRRGAAVVTGALGLAGHGRRGGVRLRRAQRRSARPHGGADAGGGAAVERGAVHARDA